MKQAFSSRLNDLKKQIEHFLLDPASARPLAILRIGVALVLIIQAFLLRNDLAVFFSHGGLVQGSLAAHLSEPNTPRLGWLTDRLAIYGISEMTVIFFVTRIYFFSLLLLLVGFWTRGAAVLAWFLQWTLENTGYSSTRHPNLNGVSWRKARK